LREKITLFQTEASSDVDRLMAENESISNELAKLDEQKGKLLNDKQTTEHKNKEWENKLESINEWIHLHDKPLDENQIEEVTEPKDEIKKQALHLEAEDLAIEDSQYYLERALKKGSIDLSVFFKGHKKLEFRSILPTCSTYQNQKALLNCTRKIAKLLKLVLLYTNFLVCEITLFSF